MEREACSPGTGPQWGRGPEVSLELVGEARRGEHRHAHPTSEDRPVNMPAEDALDVGAAREYFSEAFGLSECHLIENVDADSMGWMMQGHHRRRGVARKLRVEPGELAGTE